MAMTGDNADAIPTAWPPDSAVRVPRLRVHAARLAARGARPDRTMPQPLVLAILGPTATGKSTLALALADRYDGEIVNCDSTAVYRGFDIGTDKIPMAERRGIPHHLIDIVEPTE